MYVLFFLAHSIQEQFDVFDRFRFDVDICAVTRVGVPYVHAFNSTLLRVRLVLRIHCSI